MPLTCRAVDVLSVLSMFRYPLSHKFGIHTNQQQSATVVQALLKDVGLKDKDGLKDDMVVVRLRGGKGDGRSKSSGNKRSRNSGGKSGGKRAGEKSQKKRNKTMGT